jgi:hypothetical protein
MLIAERNGGDAQTRSQRRQSVVANDDEIRVDAIQQRIELVLLAIAYTEMRKVTVVID